MPVVPARAAVDSGHNQRTRWEPGSRSRSSDAHAPIFKGLPKRLQHTSPKFGQLVQKKHALVSETDLAWTGDFTTTDKGGFAD